MVDSDRLWVRAGVILTGLCVISSFWGNFQNEEDPGAHPVISVLHVVAPLLAAFILFWTVKVAFGSPHAAKTVPALPDKADIPPALFEPASHPGETFPVTRKRAVRDDAPTTRYKSKVYVEFINNTPHCAEINIVRWVRGIRATVLHDVLQTWLVRSWCPTPDGASKLHVPGGERFRLSIAPDTEYSRDDLQRFCDEGRLGTIAILINGREREISL